MPESESHRATLRNFEPSRVRRETRSCCLCCTRLHYCKLYIIYTGIFFQEWEWEKKDYKALNGRLGCVRARVCASFFGGQGLWFCALELMMMGAEELFRFVVVDNRMNIRDTFDIVQNVFFFSVSREGREICHSRIRMKQQRSLR